MERPTPYIAVGRAPDQQTNGKVSSDKKSRGLHPADKLGLGNDTAPLQGLTWRGTYAVLELVQKGFGVRWIWPGPSGEVFTPRTLGFR